MASTPVSANSATITNGNNTSLGNVQLLQDLTLNATGTITQSGALNIGGNSSFTGTDITLNSANTFTGTVAFTGANVGITDSTPLSLAASTATGTLALTTGGALTQTGTLTAGGNATLTATDITLANTGVQDVAGNPGSGTTDSNNFAVDSQRPTATIVLADATLSAGETSLVTITFSEAVTGFTLADLTVANGSLSGLSTSDNITYTATFTPSVGVSAARHITPTTAVAVASAIVPQSASSRMSRGAPGLLPA